jgi:hypothetical protein
VYKKLTNGGVFMKKGIFKIGDGVTLNYCTDRHAYTVIKTTKNSITIQRDTVKQLTKPEFVIGGFAGHCGSDLFVGTVPSPQQIKGSRQPIRRVDFGDWRKREVLE